jgi:hypothetical protein
MTREESSTSDVVPEKNKATPLAPQASSVMGVTQR